MANFAPYQDIPPDRNRALSPPPANPRSPPPTVRSPRTSIEQTRRQNRNIGTVAASNTIKSPTTPSYHRDDYFGGTSVWRDEEAQQPVEPEEGGGGFGSRWGGGGRREDVQLFETRLGIRLDWEACLAYLLLPPVGGVLLLVFEHTSDYVRFHAWQSSLVFTFMFILHVVLSWSSILSWILFAGDIFLIALLTFHAYKDATTLDRFQVPVFGAFASKILDDE